MKVYRFLMIALICVVTFHIAQSQVKMKNIQIDFSVKHDSLVYKALGLTNANRLRFGLPQNLNPNKCGLEIEVEYKKRRKYLNETDKVLLDQIFSREIMDTSILSKKNNFRIHYNKTGIDAPNMTDADKNGIPDFVDSVAYYFEYCLDKEVNVLGFEGLVPDNNAGGGNEFDVYIKDLSSGTYGYTTYEDNIEAENTVPKYTSFITIDNDFNDLYTSGINGMKITAGHELFHAIQIGRYGLWSDDVYYYEMLSTWMETYLFSEVKDYYQYLPSYFNSTGMEMWRHSGYDMAIWPIFLAKKYSPLIIRNILEGFKKYSPLQATEKTLNSYNSALKDEFADFSIWVYFTSYRSKSGFYFPDSKNYPIISGNSLKLVNFTPPSCSITSYLLSLGIQYFALKYNDDTINIISSRTSLNEVFNKTENYSLGSIVFSDNNSDLRSVTLTGGLKYFLTADLKPDWKVFYLLNNDFISVSNEVKVYPNPLIQNENSKLSFDIPVSIGSTAELYILSNDLRLIYESKQTIKPILGGNGIDWDCKDNNGKFISSGVYYYFLKAENKEWKNKFAVLKKK